jgi:alpha-methylacyl-CoA racemase
MLWQDLFLIIISIQCKDGKWIALGSLEPKFWMGFCQLVGKAEWMNKIFNATLIPEVEQLFLTKTRDEWVNFAKDSDICLTAILEMDELESDEYLQKRNMFVESMSIQHTVNIKGSINQ